MELKRELLQKLQDLAYHYAIYKIGDWDVAKDIASQSINLYVLKADIVEKPESWIIGTCNNYCKKYLANQKKEFSLEGKLHNSVVNSFLKNESDDSLKEAFEQALKKVSEDDLTTLLFYMHCEKNIKRMSDLINLPYSRLQKRINIIKRTIKAETYRNLGVIASQKIVTPKLSDLIIKFLKRFKKHLENYSLHKMYYYFSEIDLKHYNPEFEIEKIIDYELQYDEGIYSVYVIFETKEKDVETFYIKFYINPKNYLKVITPPTKIDKPAVVEMNSNIGIELKKLLYKYPEDRTGISTVPKEELEKILKEIQNK